MVQESLKSGGWPSGAYRLVVSHQDAKAELPIELD
jgi:hypothetical protein